MRTSPEQPIAGESSPLHDYIRQLRKDYSNEGLDEKSVNRDPFRQFEMWLESAVKGEVLDPHAMIIATASANGVPSVRTVLLREFDSNGFVFYTNYRSRKALEISANPKASALFFWREVERQIRIEGIVEKVDTYTSDHYFQSRPRDSQISAWASNQSEPLGSRSDLERSFEKFEIQFVEKSVPRPEFWGGYRLKPDRFEFWQGRPSRLHDRILYTRKKDDSWDISRLAP